MNDKFWKYGLFRSRTFVYNKSYVNNYKEVITLTPDKNIAGEEKPEVKKESWQKTALLYLHDLIYMLAVIMVVFLLVFRLVIVSGDSMYSTLWDGDWLLVLSNTFYREPEYGDIIVASKDSFNNGEAIIKRVIATEGQTVDIDFVSGVVFVDGVPLQEDYTFTKTNIEEGTSFPLVVEEGCVFAMGDNRNASKDSRHPAIGQIDRREIMGKALFLFLPGADDWTGERSFDRIGAVN